MFVPKDSANRYSSYIVKFNGFLSRIFSFDSIDNNYNEAQVINIEKSIKKGSYTYIYNKISLKV